MRIGIIGYGKMGKTIEKLAHERGHSTPLIVDKDNQRDFETYEGQLDAVVEFTTPDTAVANIKLAAIKEVPIIVGTTGWMNHLEEVKAYVEQNNGTLFYSSNFSLGVNIFFKLNQWLASVMNKYPEYRASIDETHHTQKLDKPSGTALTLAEGLISEVSNYDGWSLDTADQINKLPVFSHRKGEVPGTHSISYKSAIDELFIQHTANGREGFAMGAVLVAEWIADKKGLLTMNDFLNF